MKYATVCSGVEAASLAWMPLGWEPVFFSEIELFPCALLKYRFPNVPNLGDMTKIEGEKYRGAIDLLAGGTPCQDVSVAGKRAGFAGERSGLAYTFVELLRTIRPRWFVWENVPGVLSSNKGIDFRDFIGKIVGVGYSVGWRILDVQYTRVPAFPMAIPQRRRRVWAVGHIGADAGYPAEVLFEPGCLRGDFTPRRETGKGNPAGVEGGIGRTGGCGVSATIDSDMSKIINNQNGVPGKLIMEASPTLQTTCGDYSRSDGFVALLCRKTGHGKYAEDSITSTLKARDGKGDADIVVCAKDSERGVDCMTPGQPQTERVYGTGGAFPSLSANSSGGQNRQAVLAFENHSQDSRYRALDGEFPAIPAQAGTGGNNLPLVASKDDAKTFAIACNLAGRKPENGGNGKGFNEEGPAYTLDTTGGAAVCAIPIDTMNALDNRREGSNNGTGIGKNGYPCPTIGTEHCHAVGTEGTVRRLTPTECERLMGFPDGWTRIPWRGKTPEECPDAPRYKAIGNSWGVNCAMWIGARIQLVDSY